MMNETEPPSDFEVTVEVDPDTAPQVGTRSWQRTDPDLRAGLVGLVAEALNFLASDVGSWLPEELYVDPNGQRMAVHLTWKIGTVHGDLLRSRGELERDKQRRVQGLQRDYLELSNGD